MAKAIKKDIKPKKKAVSKKDPSAPKKPTNNNIGPQILNAAQKHEVTNEIAKWIIEGIGFGDLIPKIQQFLLTKGKEVNINYCKSLIIHTRQTLEEESLPNAGSIINTHINHYEAIYSYYNQIQYAPGELKAMRGKEKLLGLYKDNQTLVINNKKKTVIKPEEQYDRNKLTNEEQSRLDILLRKASGDK